MELGYIILAIFLVFGPITLAIIAMVRVSGLERRIAFLERAVSRSASDAAPKTAPDIPPAAQTKPAAPQPQAARAAPADTPIKSAPWSAPVDKDLPATTAKQPRPAAPPRRDSMDRLQAWAMQNWVYLVAGVSLAFAGIFFVQYGIEHGILSPTARVMSGIVFGFVMMGAGVFLHRRSAAQDDDSLMLPSVLIGAGVVSVFAATVAARQLYGLIGPEIALIAHVLTALLAVAFGWVFGPILVALGLGGGFAAPFIVGGSSDNPSGLFAYFVLLAALGLGVDLVRRTAWISGLGLSLGALGALLISLMAGVGFADLGYAAFLVLAALGLGMAHLRQWNWLSWMALGYSWLGIMVLQANAGSEGGAIAALVALLLLAVTIPAQALLPRVSGRAVLQSVLKGGDKPQHLANLAMGANLAVSAALLLIAVQSDQPFALIALWALAVSLPIWLRFSPALADAVFPPALAALAVLAVQIVNPTAWAVQFMAERGAEIAAPLAATLILAAAGVVGLVLLWQARGEDWIAQAKAQAAPIVLPLAIILVEFGLNPASVLGPYAWALHVIAGAAMSVWLAYRFRLMGAARPMALAALAALTLIALAMVTVMSGPALTLALAALIVAAAALDRRFDMREMVYFSQLALAVVTYRLLVDPGIFWALRADLVQPVLAFGGSLAAIFYAMTLCAADQRAAQRKVLQTALLVLGAVFADVLILRALDSAAMDLGYVRYSILALPWLVLAITQSARALAAPKSPFLYLHQAVTGLASIFALGLLAIAVMQSPLTSFDLVVGPFLLDSAFAAYAVPAVILGAAGLRFILTPPNLRKALLFLAAGLAALYGIIEIRRFWNGDLFTNLPIGQGELYTYTVALMLVGAGLIHTAIRHHSEFIRRVGMAVIALTVAKVFLWDASGLTGLTRVASFAGLGLALLGLAQLNRWAAGKTKGADA